MQCNCGSHTVDHDVAEDGQIVAKFAKCVSCGRIRWWYDNREDESDSH